MLHKCRYEDKHAFDDTLNRVDELAIEEAALQKQFVGFQFESRDGIELNLAEVLTHEPDLLDQIKAMLSKSVLVVDNLTRTLVDLKSCKEVIHLIDSYPDAYELTRDDVYRCTPGKLFEVLFRSLGPGFEPVYMLVNGNLTCEFERNISVLYRFIIDRDRVYGDTALDFYKDMKLCRSTSLLGGIFEVYRRKGN